MNLPRFSLSIAHTPWIDARVTNLREMLLDLLPLSRDIPFMLHDTDYRGRAWEAVKVEWALKAWRWHLDQAVSHCVLLSDDLRVMPRFWDVLEHMVAAAPRNPLGLMSNHPEGPRLFEQGKHWYRTRAWLVGPAIVFPRDLLGHFVTWYEPWIESLPRGEDRYGFREFFHDDSSMNEWCHRNGRDALHPLPAPIEHQLYLGRSHDAKPFPRHAAEWISWKRVWHANPARDRFSEMAPDVAAAMATSAFWRGADEAPGLRVV